MLKFLQELWANDVLWVAIIASLLAQFLKPFTAWLRTKEFDWSCIADTGGMPSSHSALVTAAATGIGIEQGFDSPFFAIAVALAVIVTYDAGGIRRQAGDHARAINVVIAELLKGHPIEAIHFKEVLGHSRWEVVGGIFFGISVMCIWEFLLRPLF